MPQFFLKSSNITGNQCCIDGDDYYHLTRARRIKEGEIVNLRSDNGMLYKARISKINNSSMVAEIIEKFENSSANIELTLCAGLLKGKKFDLVLRKVTEIGVHKIIPVITERTIPDISRYENKRNRWQKILREASKQSMRSAIPALEDITDFSDIVSNDTSKIKIIAHTDTNCLGLKEYLSSINLENDVSLLIGPEGGFSNTEVEFAKKNGWIDIVSGFSSLRSETAAIVLPAIFIYEWSANIDIK